jgi:hypothetical protein
MTGFEPAFAEGTAGKNVVRRDAVGSAVTEPSGHALPADATLPNRRTSTPSKGA